jgi:uncharacterized protein YjbI with pentapeptide repeats
MKILATMQKFSSWIIGNEILTTFLVFAILSPIVILLDRKFSIKFQDVLSNVNGSLFDLILFGVIFVVFNKMRSRSSQIKELSERIEDFRDWKSDEAKFRIFGAVKRLQRLGVKQIDLNRCKLNDMIIDGYHFEDSDLNCIDLSRAYIRNCTFLRCNFKGAQLYLSSINDSKLIDCDLDSANLFQINLFRTDFTNSNLKTFSQQNNSPLMNIMYECTGLNSEFLESITKSAPKILEKPDFDKVNRFEYYKMVQEKKQNNNQ